MPPKMYTITVPQVIEAFKKNGYPWTKNAMFDDGASCALGQAARNLFDNPDQGWPLLYAIDKLHYRNNLGHSILAKNDDPSTETYEEVVAFVEEILTPYLDSEIHVWVE